MPSEPAARPLGDLVRTTVSTALRDKGLSRGDVLLVAFSGGPDSTALLHAVASVAREGGPAVELVAAHYDHGLRPESADEASAAHRAAEALEIEFVHERSSGLATTGRGVEHAARIARYAFLSRLAVDRGARAVATAHHRDDRIETVLHRLLQGARLTGLSGMPRSRPLEGAPGCHVLRPLFDLPAAVVRQYAEETGLEFVEDPTNSGDANARAVLRSSVLPVIERAYPHAAASLLRLEAAATEARDLVEQDATAALSSLVIEGKSATVSRANVQGRGVETVRWILRAMAAAIVPGQNPDVPEAALMRVMEALGTEDQRARRVPVGKGLEAVIDAEGVGMTAGD